MLDVLLNYVTTVAGELFGADVRELAGSLATMTNWLSSFVVTLVFAPLQVGTNISLLPPNNFLWLMSVSINTIDVVL